MKIIELVDDRTPEEKLQDEKEAKTKQTLQEVLRQDYVMDLNEIFDTHIPINKWYYRGTTLVGQLNVDGELFNILFEPGRYRFDQGQYMFINVAFEKIVNGESTRELQFNSRKASSIVGAIVNALIDKLKDFQHDAIIFGASDNIEKRMRIYNTIANRFAKTFRFVIRDVKTNDGIITILISKSVSQEHASDFIEYLKTRNK